MTKEKTVTFWDNCQSLSLVKCGIFNYPYKIKQLCPDGLLERNGKPVKTGIIDVGGGFRGIYAAGVLDYCMDQGIRFDLGIGISAGSANIISFAAGQCRRNYQFYSEYGLRKEYAGLKNFITKNSFVDMDYVYGTLSNSDGENPLDFDAVVQNPMELVFIAADAETGKTKYFSKRDVKQDDYSVMKASCAIPLVCHPYAVGDTFYFDGALGDPVPVQKAFDLGCDRVILILTRPENVLRDPKKDRQVAAVIRHRYPRAAERLCLRAQMYNEGVALAKQYAAQGKALIVAPDDTCGVSTLTRDFAALDKLYHKGYADGKKIGDYLEKSR